jgi:hypothetical protein
MDIGRAAHANRIKRNALLLAIRVALCELQAKEHEGVPVDPRMDAAFKVACKTLEEFGALVTLPGNPRNNAGLVEPILNCGTLGDLMKKIIDERITERVVREHLERLWPDAETLAGETLN